MLLPAAGATAQAREASSSVAPDPTAISSGRQLNSRAAEACNGEQPVQEGVFRFPGLETRQRSKVGSSRRPVVTDPLERHVNEGAVVGLKRDAQVELDDAVRAFERPIVAPRQHLAAKPVPFER